MKTVFASSPFLLSSAAIVALSIFACSADGGTGSGSETPGVPPLGGDGEGTVGSLGDGDGDGDGDVPNGTPSAVAGVSLGGWSGACGVLPVTFRDFRGYGTDGGTNPDFEISASYPAGGANWRSDKYGDPPGTQAYQGVNEAGCDLILASLDANLKPQLNPQVDTLSGGLGLGRARTLDPPRAPGVIQRVIGCAENYAWPWDWTPPPVINSTATFAEWYNDVETVNTKILGDLTLTEGVFDSAEFFPLDNQGFGNTAGQLHNYHFTTEAHVSFTYTPGSGQTFSFTGDDDLWIFVNGVLAMDLGGVHEPMVGTIDFDTQAAALGLTEAGDYSFDIFHAERQTVASNFRVETNISCFRPPVR